MARKPNEDAMLDMVGRLDAEDGTDYGDGPEDDNEELDEGDEESSEDDEGSEDVDGDEDDSDPDSDADDSDDDSGSERNERVQSRNEDLRALPNGLFQDRQGNLVDAKGVIVARAGSERRLFERSQRMGVAIEERNNRITQLEQEVQRFQSVLQEPTRLGLNAEDLQVGYPIVAEFKKDPVQAVRKLLEMVIGMGHDLNEIVADAPSLGVAGFQRMLDERLAPIAAPLQQQRQREEQRRAADAAVESFVAAHEHADVHLEAIDNLLGRRKELTPERAYYELKMFAVQNNLDFTKPLGPQIQQRQSGAKDRQQSSRRQPARNLPLPNGRQRASVASMGEPVSASATDSWDRIINNALKG